MTRPYTVLMMIPEDMREDEVGPRDWVRVVWIHGVEGDLLDTARQKLVELFEWTEIYTEAEIEERKEMLEPLAIFAGHHFDIYGGYFAD